MESIPGRHSRPLFHLFLSLPRNERITVAINSRGGRSRLEVYVSLVCWMERGCSYDESPSIF